MTLDSIVDVADGSLTEPRLEDVGERASIGGSDPDDDLPDTPVEAVVGR